MINSVRIASVRKKTGDEDDPYINTNGDLNNNSKYTSNSNSNRRSPSNGVDEDNMSHNGALGAVKKAQYSLSFLLQTEHNKSEGNAIHQVGLTPEVSNNKPKVSLVIGPKRAVSCEAINDQREDSGDSNTRRSNSSFSNSSFNSNSQTYVKKFSINKSSDDLPIEVTCSSPRGLRRDIDRTASTPERSNSSNNYNYSNNNSNNYSSNTRDSPRDLHVRSKSLPRRSEKGGYPVQSSSVLPKVAQTSSISTAGPIKTSTTSIAASTPPHASRATSRTTTRSDLPRPLHVRSKSLPRNSRSVTGQSTISNDSSNVHPEYRSQSLPRPRNKSTSDTPSNADVPSKAPSWYKDLNKKMSSSMEKESFLSKLLEADAKKGISREIPESRRNMMQSATYEDAPRHLRDAGRGSLADQRNAPHRKSLPNLHASNFSFWEGLNQGKSSSDNKTSTPNKTTISKAKSVGTLSKPKKSPAPKWESLIPPPGVPPDLLPKDAQMPPAKSITIEYANPPDFLELRKKELKNKELEKEREELREAREKQRLSEEKKLIERRSVEAGRIGEERRRLELREEQLKLKEQLLKQEKEEEWRLQRSVENWRMENEDRLVKSREEEQHRLAKSREEESRRLLKEKEEELRRREERLLKQEEDLERLRAQGLREHKERQKKRKEEEAERIRREKEIQEEVMRQEEEKRNREEQERKQRQWEEESRRLKEIERKKQEELEKKKQEELERLREKELDRLKEEQERLRKEEEERLWKEEEERLKKEEQERLRKEEQERLRVEEQKRQKEEEQAKKRQEEFERKAKEEQDMKLQEDALRREEEDELQRLLVESLSKPKLLPYGKARFAFKAEGSGELQFKKGGIITIIDAVDENWLEGEHNGRTGIFPRSYVQLLDKLPDDKTSDTQCKPLTNGIDKNTHIYENSTVCICPPEIDQLDPKYLQPNEKSSDDSESERTSEEVSVVPQVVPETEISAEVDVLVESSPLETESKTPHQIMEEKMNLKNSTEHALPLHANDDPYKTEQELEPEVVPGAAIAKHSFTAESDTELSFQKGEEIILLDRLDDNWYVGQCNGSVGILPVNFVSVTEEPGTKPSTTRTPTSTSSPERTEQVLESEEKPSEDSVSTTAQVVNDGNISEELAGLVGVGDPHKVIYEYHARNADEIELSLGDIVKVLEKCDDHWFIGTSERTGAFGTFPGNYVVPVS